MGRLSLSVLGPVQIALDGQSASGFVYQKARALLIYLAVESDRAHSRDALVGLLWPELPDAAARTNLRQALANLRDAIRDADAVPPFLLTSRDTLQLNPACDYELDLSAFTGLLAACDRHPHRRRERCRSCATRMAEAVARYRGDFLTGFSVNDSGPFDEWQLRQRERLHERALDALTSLAVYYERRGEDEQARAAARRQIDLDPWREEAHRQLMRLLARQGQRSAALAQYEACRRILDHDLGVAPAAETTALYMQIRDERMPAPVAWTDELRPSHRFPAPSNQVIGRAKELAELGDLLEKPTCRLITISGPGGIGKTRLALAAAADQVGVYEAGAVFVPLAAVDDPANVPSAIISALGIALQGHQSPREQLLGYLRPKELLLVLDNVEQLLAPAAAGDDTVAELLSEILHQAPGVTLLVTSRERLAMPEEWLYSVAGLSCPASALDEGIESYGAVQLFVERASQVQRQFHLSDEEMHSIAHICRLVEGMPLGVELAAGSLAGRSCEAVAAAIEASISTLAVARRAVPQRHLSMTATFEHSWRLLTEEERRCFRRLSVFRGGFREEAAARVAHATPELLQALAGKSMLRWDGTGRYELHELLRQYAYDKAADAHEHDDMHRQHLAHYLELAEQAEPELRGRDQVAWLRRIDDEQGNIQAALEWARQHELPAGLRLTSGLLRYWELHSPLRDGIDSLTMLLQQPSAATAPPAVRAKALTALGSLNRGTPAFRATRALVEEALELYRAEGDQRGVAFALYTLGRNLCSVEEYREGYLLLEQSLALYESVGDKHGIAEALLWWAIFLDSTDYERARAYLERSLALSQEVGDLDCIRNALSHFGVLALRQGDYATARARLTELRDVPHSLRVPTRAWSARVLGELSLRQHDYKQAQAFFEESIALCRETGQTMTSLWSQVSMGYVWLRQGELAQAYSAFIATQQRFRDVGNTVGVVYALEGLASLATVHDVPEYAVRLYGWADAMRTQIADSRPPIEQADVDRDLTRLRARLGSATIAAVWVTGQQMSLEQAVAYVLDCQFDVTSASATLHTA